jgi:hypothetical protein
VLVQVGEAVVGLGLDVGAVVDVDLDGDEWRDVVFEQDDVEPVGEPALHRDGLE